MMTVWYVLGMPLHVNVLCNKSLWEFWCFLWVSDIFLQASYWVRLFCPTVCVLLAFVCCDIPGSLIKERFPVPNFTNMHQTSVDSPCKVFIWFFDKLDCLIFLPQIFRLASFRCHFVLVFLLSALRRIEVSIVKVFYLLISLAAILIRLFSCLIWQWVLPECSLFRLSFLAVWNCTITLILYTHHCWDTILTVVWLIRVRMII